MNIDYIICATCKKVIEKDIETVTWHVQGMCVVERSTMRYWRSVKLCSRCAVPIPILICKDIVVLRAAYHEDGWKPILSNDLGKPLVCAPCWERWQKEIDSTTWKEYEQITEGSLRS
jgi:hypothetical protein